MKYNNTQIDSYCNTAILFTESCNCILVCRNCNNCCKYCKCNKFLNTENIFYTSNNTQQKNILNNSKKD